MRKLEELHSGIRADVRWRGHQLLPATPAEGVPFHAFYLARLGSAAAVAARRAQVQHPGDAVSIAFAFDRIAVLPNTAATLRAVAQTVQRGDAAQAAVLVDRLFTAFFIDGENVGDARVLEHIPVGVRRAAGRRKFE